jgi:anti-sigma factor RsiW
MKTAAPPTDLELMLYADDELDPERRAAVEAWLETHRDDHAKLAALHLVSGMVRERAVETSAGADRIADSVMELIEREPAHGGALSATQSPSHPPTPTPHTPRPGRSPSHPPTATPHTGRLAPLRRAANDNARGFYLIAAAVVAAAAALVLWIRPEPAPGRGPLVGHASSASMPASGPPEADLEHGVEVSHVDFGSSTGAVFYVPNGTSPSDTTTVVWLSGDSEDFAGEEE